VTAPKIDSNTPTANDESPVRILCDNFILPKITGYSSWATPFHAAVNLVAPDVLDVGLESEPSCEEMFHIPGAFEAEERDAEISVEVHTDNLSDDETIHIPGAFQLENEEVVEPPYVPLRPSFLRRASLMFFGW